MSTLQNIKAGIDRLNERLGRAIAWTALALVLVQFLVVILRYIFSIGFIWMQEAVWYFHGFLFIVGAGYTLLHDGHVRVDVFYASASDKAKAWIDLLGSVFLLMPLCVFTFYISWGYVLNAWKTLEPSSEAGGLPLIFLVKTAVWIFAIVVGLQAVSLIIKALLELSGFENTYRSDQPYEGQE